MKTWIVLSILWCTLLVGSAAAEEAVSFADANLKAAVEGALGINDPTPSDMLGLTSLDASSLGIIHLTGLEYATNLQSLNLRNNKMTDLTPLAGLIQLQDLNVSRTGDTGIRDISPLAGLVNLKTLLLDNNQVCDLSPLAGLILLEHLDVHDQKDHIIRDISPLAGMVHMEILVLRYNQIWDISPLIGMKDLQHLDLGYNLLSHISPLAGMSHLQQLELYLNPLSDISDLKGLTSLSVLSLGWTELNNQAYCSHLQQILNNNPGLSLKYDPNPRSPTGLSASDGTYPDKVRISWNPVCNGPAFTTYYRVSRASSQDGPKTAISPWQTSCTFDDTTALPGTTYTYWVQTASSGQGLNTGNLSHPDTGCYRNTLHVDDDAPGDPQPGDLSVSDPQENGSTDHPFDSIQKAIDVAGNNTMVVIRPGTYFEDINLLGKSIHLTGLDPNRPSAITDYPILSGTGSGPIVRFASGEDPNCRLSGFVIAQPKALTAYAILCSKASPSFDHCLIVGNRSSASTGAAILCQDSRALFDHCTLADNQAGPQGAALALIDSNVLITHSILWGNAPKDVLLTGTSLPTITYTDLTGVWPGLGTIDDDPLFARHGYWADPEDPNTTMKPSDPRAVWVAGDYHLRSQVGRWDVKVGTWIVDEVTSPCIDAGDPARPVGYESIPNGEIVNLGAYGGTAQASRSDVGPIPL